MILRIMKQICSPRPSGRVAILHFVPPIMTDKIRKRFVSIKY